MTGYSLEGNARLLPATRAEVRGHRIGIPLWEQAFAVVGLFLCLDAGVRTIRLFSGTLAPIQSLDVSVVANYVEGNALTQSLLFTVYLVSVVLLLMRPARPLRLAAKVRLLPVLLLLATASVLWSDTPAVSLRRIAALLGSAIFGLYLATRYPRVSLLRVLLGVSVVGMALSIAVCLALPAYGIDETGAWEGVFDHKNHLGQFMALAAAAWLLHAICFRRSRPLALPLAVASGTLVVLSKSATGIVLLAALLVSLAVIWLWRLDPRATTPVVALILGIGAYGVVQITESPDGFLALLGKNATLTGRTQLWDLVGQAIGVRPWLGYGYGGFWLGFDGPSAPIWFAVGWNPPTAHNGFLDLLLDLGAVGFALFALTLLVNIRRAARLVRREPGFDAALPLLFLVFLLVSNLTESFLVTYNTLSWVWYVAITIQLHLWWRTHLHAPARAVSAMPRLALPPRLRSYGEGARLRRSLNTAVAVPRTLPPVTHNAGSQVGRDAQRARKRLDRTGAAGRDLGSSGGAA